MTEDRIKSGIAETVCLRFLNMRQATPRHGILVKFESPDILDEMERRNLVRASAHRDLYLPTVGTFALLGDDHELYQRAWTGYERTIYALWNLFRSEGNGVDHEPVEFVRYADELYSTPAPAGLIPLGLYLVREFGVLSPFKMSDDEMKVESFRVAEHVIRMRDAAAWWKQHVETSRTPISRFGVSMEDLAAKDAEGGAPDLFSGTDFWTLIHPAIEGEARPRFEAGHYADAVERALKVVAHEVRLRTGSTLDGADLMHQVFSPKRSYLVFDDPIPSTKESMQQGYMEIFAGTMTGVRNPKAHGMVQLDRRRCIHFLFLASLLRDKIDEAVTPAWLTGLAGP